VLVPVLVLVLEDSGNVGRAAANLLFFVESSEFIFFFLGAQKKEAGDLAARVTRPHCCM